MKRLRTLSIGNLEAVYRRLHKSAWGEWYWRGVRQRKELEYQRRQARAAKLVYAALQAQLASAAQDAPLPGEPAIETAARMVH